MTTGTKTIVKEIVEYTFSFAVLTHRDVKDMKIRHGGKVSCIVSGCKYNPFTKQSRSPGTL